MKKILNALFMTLLAVFTFSSCSDVPAPYDILGEGDVPGLTGDGTKENPYNIATASLKQDGSVAWVQGYIEVLQMVHPWLMALSLKLLLLAHQIF